MRNRFALLALAAVGLFAAVPASAQQTGTVVITDPGHILNSRTTGVAPDHVYGLGSFYVSPYTGTLDGQTLFMYCVDFAHNVTVGHPWNANITDLGTGFSGGNITTRNDNLDLYRRAAWLTTHSAGYSAEDLQDAIWYLFDQNVWAGGLTPTNTAFNDAAALVTMAQNHTLVADDYRYFKVLTDNTPSPLTGETQEFLVQVTPEPASLVLLATGLIGIVGVARRRGNRAA